MRCLLFHARSAYYVHETEDIYTATQLNLAKLTKEPSATYQIRLLWSQRGTKVNRRSPPWFGNRYPAPFTTIWFGNKYDKFNITRETPSAVHTQHEEHNERTEHTAVAGQPYNSSAAARWLWSRYFSTTMSMRYHCSKSLGDRTFEMPNPW